MKNTYKRGIFDRSDGWRVKDVDAVFSVVPFFLRTRMDSQNLFEEEINIDKIEQFIKENSETMPGLTIMHVFMAAIVRLYSQRPYLNRFIVWNKIYARNHINISLMIKKDLSDRGQETLIKPEFSPTDTLPVVVKKVNELIEENKNVENENGTDKIAKIIGYVPAMGVRIFAALVRGLDNIGLLPKAIMKISPWHTGAFLTNLGSVGIGPVYHHLYEFGTCSLFVAMGKKYKVNNLNRDGSVSVSRNISIKVVTDERICDGYYYALSMRMFKKYLNDLSILMTPPEKVIVDDGVKKKRQDI